MSKYNLMDNEQPGFFDQYQNAEKKSDSYKKETKTDRGDQASPIESDMAEKIFGEDPIASLSKIRTDQPDISSIDKSESEPDISSIDESESEPDKIEPEELPVQIEEIDIEESEEPITDSPLPSEEPYQADIDYEYKQPRLSYKPILIGLGIVIAITIIYFLVRNIFFTDKIEQPEAKIETPEEKLQQEQTLQKDRQLSLINTVNKYYLGYITSLFDMNQTAIQYSSILFYDKSVYFEVFAKSRDNLAKFNMQLKSNSKIPKYKIESVSSRPGSKGGVFALYDIFIDESFLNKAERGISISSTTPSNWLATAEQRNGLKLHTQRQISSRPENLFNISRMEFILTGSENKCQDLISQIVADNSNYRVHKLSLVPTNQQEMSKSPYQLTLVLDFYL